MKIEEEWIIYIRKFEVHHRQRYENDEVFESIRKNKYKLTRTQTYQLNKLLESFAEENLAYMEEIDNG